MKWTRVACLVGLFFGLQSVLAFEWEPFVFPEGDQSYTLELVTPGENGDQVATITIDITETGGAYDIATSYDFAQTGVAADDLESAALGGSMMGTFAFGPMMMFGPSFMLLPMMLGQEDIAVRAEPMLVMGMGKLTMSETVEVAGLECVVIRFEPNEGEPFEFALAENVPFPCYSRYNSGDGTIEVRLTNVE